MSTSTTSLYAVGRDPRLEKILERAKKIEEWVKYLESKAIHLQTVDRAGSEDFFEEFEVAIEMLLKDIVFNVWNPKISTSDKLSWLWLPPDYVADHRDFIGRLYYTLKLAEQIHKENSQMENIPLELSRPPPGELSPQDNRYLRTSPTNTETSSIQLPQQYQQDYHHRKTSLLISEDLAEFFEVFSYYRSRLEKYVQILRGHQTEQQNLSGSTSLIPRKSTEQPQPLPSIPFKDPRHQESCSTYGEYLSPTQQGEAVMDIEQGECRSKQKGAIAEEMFERGLKGR